MSDYLPGVALVVAVGELVANIVGTDRRSLMDSGSTLRPPMVPFSEAFFRTRIASSIGTTSLKIMVKDTTTLPFLSRKKREQLVILTSNWNIFWVNLATLNGLQTSLNLEIVLSKIGIKMIKFAIEYCAIHGVIVYIT